MRRKLCKLALVLALGSSQATWGQVQRPLPARPLQRSVLPARPSLANVLAAQPAAGVVDPAAAIWAATTQYVFESDSTLRPIAPELTRTLRRTSLKAFEQSLNQAVAVEARRLHRPALKTSALYFQTNFYNILKNSSQSPPALAAAIEARLLQNRPKRGQEPAFQAFEARLRRLMSAPGTAPTPAGATTTPASVAATPASAAATAPATSTPHGTEPAAPATPPAAASADAPTSWWTWLALGLAALSVAGVAVLWSKLGDLERELERLRDKMLTSSQPRRSEKEAFRVADVLPAIQQEVSRQLQQQQAGPPASAPGTPAGAAPGATAAPELPA